MLSIKSLPKLQIGPDCFLFFSKWSHLLHPIHASRFCIRFISNQPSPSSSSRFDLLHLPKIQASINRFDNKTSSPSSSQNPSLNQQIQQQNYQIRQQNYQIRSSPLRSDYLTPNYQIRLILSRKKALVVVFLAHRFLIFLISSFSHLQ